MLNQNFIQFRDSDCCVILPVWDQKLYEDAKTHARKCVFEHNPEAEIYGENLALSYGEIAE
ncbi:hypothetical protein X801_08475 [Opisthorchis viverrini]|uniref:SCP domain-containing protein n=1 Tax=Opisthorchis viverrini TaxID=6198 RepID=A0A1S8WMK0_OPIVI|nr:hypothetical protein X801_08475 [Opisthorchis viverrini]